MHELCRECQGFILGEHIPQEIGTCEYPSGRWQAVDMLISLCEEFFAQHDYLEMLANYRGALKRQRQKNILSSLVVVNLFKFSSVKRSLNL